MKTIVSVFVFSLLFFAVQAQSPVSYYPFSGNANDAIGTKHGTVNGPALTFDRFGNANSAYSFDGINDVIELNHAFNGFTELTLSAWVNINGANQANDLQAIISSDVSGNFVHLQCLPGSVTNSAVYIDNSSSFLLDIPAPVVNTWYFVTLVAKSGSSKMYINGVEYYSSSTTFTNISNSNLLRIGSGYQNGRFLNGKIDDIKVYNTALTATQILAEYNNVNSSLIAYYPFSGNANDAIGSNNGTVNGATLTTDRNSVANSAYHFDGVDDLITAAIPTSATSNVTMAAWVKLNGTSTNQVILYNGNSSLNGYGLYLTSSGVLNMLYGGLSLQSTSTTLNLNQWYHLSMVLETNNTAKIYVNGNLVFTSTPMTPNPPTTSLFMSSNSIGTEYLNGVLDEVKIYNTALTASQVQAEYNTSSTGLIAYYPFTGNANDAIGTNHGTVNGATLTTDHFGNANSAYSFNGTTNYVEVTDANSIDLNINFTISTWLFPTGPGSVPQEGGIIINKEYSYEIVRFTNGTIQFALSSNGTGNDWNYVNTSIVAPLNTWTHITLVKSGSVVTVYKNGTLEFTDNSQPVSLAANTSNLRIGGRTFTPHFFDGKLDEVKIYNTALSAAQILTEYNNGVSNLIAYYKLNANAGDSSGNNLHGTIIGAPTFTTDRHGNANSAIAFDGNVANRIEVDDNLLLHTPSITLSAWVKLNTLGGIRTFVDKPMGTSFTDSWHFGTENSNFSSWHFDAPTLTPYSQVTSPGISGQWAYVVNTFDNNTKQHKLYVDGILKATNTFNSTIGYDNSKMYIGAAIENGGLAYPMDGAIDEVKIYGSAMTQSQISAEYVAELAMNASGSGNAISFNGNNNYLQLPSLLHGANIFTTEFWVKTTESGSNGTFWQRPTILGNANPAAPDGDFGITINNGQIGFWCGLGFDQELQTSKVINDNQWHHVAAVNNGSSMILYVDGILLPGSLNTSGGALQTVNHPWRVGMSNSCCSGGSPFNGTVDELRIWNTALTETQLRDRMCKKVNSTDALYNNLVAYYNFDETLGSTCIDGSSLLNLASLINSPARLTSGAPIGNTSAHNYSGSSASVNLVHPDRGDDVTVTLASGAADGVHVYHVNEAPNTRSGIQGLDSNKAYFGTFVVGGSIPTFDVVYNYDGIPNIPDENALSLFSRNENSINAWVGELALLNTTANTLSKSGIAASQKEFIIGANDPGNISSNQSSCIAVIPVPLTGTAAFNGAPGVTYQWQDSTAGGNWQNISGATNSTPLVLSLASSPKYYRRLATLNSLTLSSNIVFLDIKNAIAPNILPSNQWNLYAYEGSSVDSVNVTYKGSYTRTGLGINTITDYGSGNNPGAASGYAGCTLAAPNNIYSLYAKRKGFPTESYALNIPLHDDEIKIYQDGVLLLSAGCCNNLGSQYYTLGTLNSNSVIECRVTNSGGGPGQLVVDIFQQNLNGGTVGSNQSNCAAFTPTIINNLHPAYGGSSKTITYQWQESNDNITFTDISGETSLTYQPGLVSADKYFRRKATNSNNEVAFSNVVLMDINGPAFYADLDGDGFGDPNNFVQACAAPPGYLTDNTDCNDNDTLQHPGQIWYLDADNDGYKAFNAPITQCTRPLNRKAFSELLSSQSDCNDNHNHIHPGAQYLTFTGANNYVSNICNPLLGDAFTTFRYEVMYFNIYNEMPENGAPRLSVDLGQNYVLDPGDKRVSMQQDDVNDTNTQDGKKYFLNVSGIQPGIALQSYVSPHLVNCDFFGPFLNEPTVVNFPNLSIAAADITFSNYNPDVSTSITVTAVVRNPSSYDATNIPVRLLNQFDTTQTYPIQTIAFIPSGGDATVNWTITTPSISALCPMKVVVDYGNTLNETNEIDNTAIRAFVNGNGSVSGGILVTSSVTPKTVLTGAGNPGMAVLSGNAQYTGLALALNNAAVPGAEVSCTLVETGQTFTGVTDGNGDFSIPFTAPIGAGTYHFSGTVYDFTWAGFMQVDSNAFTVVPAVGQSDLVPAISMQSPAQILVGDTIKVKYRSHNMGFIATTGNHTCKLSITGPSGFSLEDSTIVGSLLSNTSSTEILVETAPLTVSGTYVITVSTDTDDEEIESSESNNSVTSVVEVVPQQVDVIGQSVQVIGGNQLCNSQQIVVQAQIKNTGSIATASTNQSTMTIKQGSTILAAQTFLIPILQSNESASISKTLVVPYTPGSYTVELSADISNVLSESNESNNISAHIINLDTCKADLAMADFCNNVAVQGLGNNFSGPVTLSAKIKNNGKQNINPPITVRFLFNTNDFFDYVHNAAMAPDDIVNVDLPVASLPANASSVQVVIDPLNMIDEISNTNNESEIKPLGLDFSPVSQGCVIPIDGYQYYTSGFVHFYSSIKSNNLFSNDSVKVNFKLSGPGISGQQDMGSTYLYNVSPTCFCPQVASIPTLHLLSLPGTYHIQVTVDPDNEIVETNETNNVIVYHITTQDLPDMYLKTTFINPSNLNPAAGQSITTQVTYGNLGVGNVSDTMKLKLYIDNIPIDSVENAIGLPSNGTNTYTFNTPWSSIQPGVHLIKTTIDEDQSITEIDENNNTAVRAIIVGDAANMYFDSLGTLNGYPQLGDSAIIYTDIGNNGTLSCSSALTFYFLNDFNDTLLIRNYTVTVAPNGHQIISFKWKVIDEKTVVLAKLTNSSVQEFDYADNSASFAFGKMKLITEAVPACNPNGQGSITAHILGGSPPFTYAWSNNFNAATMQGVPGNYAVTVFDQSGQQVQGNDSIPICIGGLLYVKCYLQGFYEGNGKMSPVLTQSGFISPLGFTDTVTIELHETSSGLPLSASFKGILHRNGEITCHVPLSELGSSRYLVVKHRNHLETWSANPVVITNMMVYNFSQDATQAAGNNQIELESGTYGIYTGDMNQDGVVDGLDYNDWETDNNNFGAGYLVTDLNGDGIVDGLDFLLWEQNSNNFVGAIVP